MKTIIRLFALTAILAVLTLSCSKDKENEPISNGTATIHGIAYANLDLTNETKEFVPQGTVIYAEIDTEDLVENPDNSLDYGTKQYSTTVGANGEFTFTVDANNTAVTVSFYGDDFQATQISSEKSETKTFALSKGNSITVYKGIKKYVEVTYSVQ